MTDTGGVSWTDSAEAQTVVVVGVRIALAFRCKARENREAVCDQKCDNDTRFGKRTNVKLRGNVE